MNKCELLGRLTKDPDVRYTPGEKSTCVARFSLAVTRRFNREEADFINCVCFGKTGEFIQKYVKKGSQICVAGRIQTGKYKNREGVMVYTTDVVVEDVDLCGSRNDSQQKQGPAPTGQANYEQMTYVDDSGFMAIDESAADYLPFNP